VRARLQARTLTRDRRVVVVVVPVVYRDRRL